MASFRDYEMSRPTIQEWAVIWMKKYLVIHIISLVPWDLIFMNQHWHTYLQLFRFFRLYRIANKIKRCAIYKQLFVYLDNKYGSAVGDVLPILCIIFFVVHTNACLMYLIGKYKGFPGWDDPWKQFHDATIGDLYAWTFYMTVGNMLPMSFMARSTPEIVRTMFTMMIGSSMVK
ncbi:hypothetical protein BC830DRAFT_657350 [Chytriomyces sp. MP71]|nr:hypothetical protein BC830DRAFT_657350 [Chytriomyces sp. MP71]